jgi:Fe-S cluster assembly protein SufD
MIENFKINSKEIDKIKKITKKERDFRIKNLNLFNKKGFPNKKHEDWKFSDLREIVYKNFKELNVNNKNSKVKKANLIKDFDHNYIMLVNGELKSNNFKFEEKNKIKIETFQNNNFLQENKDNSLIHLNHALSNNGFSLEVEDGYKFKKVLIIYNLFTKDLKENILNSRNKIKIGKNSELHAIDFVENDSKYKFMNNVYENIILESNAVYRNICIQNDKSEGYFHKFSKNKLSSRSKYSAFIFPSGLKFNKLDLEFNLKGENSECNLQSASFLNKSDHQEIKTKINHLAPSCKSYQRVKNVLSSEGKGVFQGKVYVKDIAQKTNAYQLSKALMLSDDSEFDSKPELEIYADDVKCSHGSTSGSVDENSIYYLMTRGLSRKESIRLLINGFLNEVVDMIKNNSVRKFVRTKLEEQIHGY